MDRLLSLPKPYRNIIFLLAWLICCPGYAEIYKWVDADGKVHFADNTKDAGDATVEKLETGPLHNVMTDYAPPQSTASPAASKPPRRQPQPVQAPAPRDRGWGGDRPETDSSRCALARDILAGIAVHGNGVATDAHDIRVAERDVQKFCH